MSYNYTLKYRSFNNLLDEVSQDFSMYELENLIGPEQLMKVAKRINYDLGLRIMMTKEALLEVEQGRVKLPDDFYVLNYALICDETCMVTGTPQGTHLEEQLIPKYQDAPIESSICTPPQIDCRTTVAGCCTSCGCSCDSGQTLCPQCQPENTLCSTTSVTTTTTVIPGTTEPIHSCYWVNASEKMLLVTDIVIVINGISYSVAPFDVNNLNTLGLGSFSILDTGSMYYVVVLGSEDYGTMTCHTTGGDFQNSVVCTTIGITTGDTRVCSWVLDIKSAGSVSAYSIIIDGTKHTFSGAFNIVDLNALGLGTFSVDISSGIYQLIVHGNHVYGPITYTIGSGKVTLIPFCTPVLSTPGSTTTTITADKEYHSNPPVCKPRVVLNCQGDQYELVQIINPATINYYKRLMPLKMLENPESIDCGCPNLYINSGNTGWIKNGFLFTNFPEGKVYISYQGVLVDDDNNILVPDHDGLNDYYEYALKQRILENLMMNDEPIGQKLQLIEARLRTARLYALTIVNTPNFAEMRELWWSNRKAQYAKYYEQFKSYSWYQWDRNPNLDLMVNPSL